jgi:DNA-directed RNA polymerase subunit RPC12/RpoP
MSERENPATKDRAPESTATTTSMVDDPATRYRCAECKRDMRLRPFVRLLDGRIVCRRCHRDYWVPR